jgi:hypothetical protein
VEEKYEVGISLVRVFWRFDVDGKLQLRLRSASDFRRQLRYATHAAAAVM